MATIRLNEKALAGLPSPTVAAQAYYWDTELTGFGVVVGRTGRRTFVVRARAAGRLIKRTIGVAGAPRADGHRWTVQLARIEARQLLGQLASGTPPPTRGERLGPTLRDGLTLHTDNMRKRGRAASSIDTITSETERHLEDWLERPIAELRGPQLVALHTSLTTSAGATIANRVVAHVSACWNALDRVHEFDFRNPAKAVERNPYVPSRERIADEDLAGWYSTVQTLSPVRRDLRLFALFTGLRDESARHARWEHIDFDAAALEVPKPKGGEAKAFRLPLASSMVEMLRARRTDNATRFAAWKGGDGGWVFPTVSADGKRVVPIVSTKEQRVAEDEKGKPTPEGKKRRRAQVLPGMHVSRRTYLSVATEVGIAEIDRHVLANHSYSSQNVNATYIAQSFAHLAECQARIEAALWRKLKPDDLTRARYALATGGHAAR
jgi:integrase